VPAAELVLSADATRLERALRALVANATEAGAQTVTVRARREPHVVRFEVEDDGPGFDPRAPVFDAFYTTKADGTGLGLAIVHRTITDHGGSIDVESRAGYTRFRLTVPWNVEGTNG
jgi:signal transduction histidine kinase